MRLAGRRHEAAFRWLGNQSGILDSDMEKLAQMLLQGLDRWVAHRVFADQQDFFIRLTQRQARARDPGQHQIRIQQQRIDWLSLHGGRTT